MNYRHLNLFAIPTLLLWCLGLRAEPNWKDPQWLRLLHYQKSWDGSYSSQADGKNFFLSPHGKSSPQKELSAFLRSLTDIELDESKSSFCRYPARVRWLKKNGHSPQQNIECKELEQFRQQVAARSIAVVFSSYYLSNPVSSFGHTFLRIGKNESDELLDTGVNFSAQTGDEGMLSYMYKGLTGGFPGEFQAVPYYDKVHDYNDSELRDLWSYELNLTQEEIDFVVDHLWELRKNHFDYFFLSENCSYHVLTLLEAARPQLKLSENTSQFMVIPSETLKTIHREGLIKAVSFRPSPERIYHQLRDSLMKSDREDLPGVIKDPSLVNGYASARAAQVLDAALANLELEHSEKLRNNEPEIVKQQRMLLIKRSQVPVRSPKQTYGKLLGSAPHLGHGAKRLSVGELNRDDKTLMTLGLRMAQHDVLDNDTSYLPRAGLEVLEVVGRSDGRRVEIEQFSIINTINLRDISELKSPLSWKARVGGWRDFYRNEEIKEYGFAGGMGISQDWGPASMYLLSHLETVYAPSPSRQLRPSLGADVGLLLRLAPGIKWHSFYGLRDYRWNESFVQNELRLSNLKFGLGVQSNYYLQSQHSDLLINGFFYF